MDVVVVCPRSDFKHLAMDLVNCGDTVLQTAGTSDAGCRLVETVLSGGAPWGFTLRGGREHREPLLITKVEEGSKAATAGLQVGDELASINSVPLSGFRQEAICLVKSSHKTLALTLRRKMKMVDMVTQTMPAENEVHVARNFLTKILRSSMRRTEPAGRPHSWHSSKLAENQIETQKITQNPDPEPVWQSKYSISSSSNDVSKCWDTTKHRQAPSQLPTVQDMEAVDPSPQTNSSMSLPATKHHTTVDLASGGRGGGVNHKRDSPHTILHTLPNNLDHSLSKSQATSLECMFYRGTQGEAGGQPERPRYLQLPMGNGGRVSPRLEDQVSTRYSSSPSSCVGGSRSNISPVWHVPDTKKPSAPSPPPPPPPLRSDSFAATTKVHEKGLSAPLPEGPPTTYPQQRAQGRSTDRLFKATENPQKNLQPGERTADLRQTSVMATQKNDAMHPYHLSAEDYNANQLSPNKLSSLSSTDVRQGLVAPDNSGPDHQRQHSDESHFYLYPKASSASVPKPQSMGGYYHSLQELPTNTCSRVQNQARTSTTSLSSTALDQSLDRGAHARYYCYSSQQPMLSAAAPQGCPQGKTEAWRGESESERSPVGSQRAIRNKYHPAAQQAQNGHGKQTGGHATSESPSAGLNVWMARSAADERERKTSGNGTDAHHHGRYPHGQLHGEHRGAGISQPHREPQPDPWVSQESRKICPQQTPLLHCLSQENKLLTEKRSPPSAPPATAPTAPQDAPEPAGGKQGRRSDRYATTLRNEIIIKRAQLQKSRSAAALSCPAEADDEQEPAAWRSTETSTSSSDGSFSNTYKDHLKEAQARVLQATSYKRKDLELTGSEASPGCLSAMLAHRDLSIGEILSGKTGAAASGTHVSRIGSRKRFPMSKRVHSFSEPDKINEVGVEGKELNFESVGSFIDRRMFFEGVTKPAFSKPAPKQAPQSSLEEHVGGKPKGLLSPPGNHHHGGPARESHSKHHSGKEHGWPKQDLLQPQHQQHQQQRLGTFAEYEATWYMQRKPSEAKSSGRYRSAENILEPSAEDRDQSVCVHERSRSSPSADLHDQKIPLPGRKSHPERQAEAPGMGVLAERGPGECRVWERPAQLDHFPPPSDAAALDPERKDVPLPGYPPDPRHQHHQHHQHHPQPHTHTPEPPPYSSHLRHVGVTATPEQAPLPKKRGAALPQRFSPPRPDTPGAAPLREPGDPVRGRSPGAGLALSPPSVPAVPAVPAMPAVPAVPAALASDAATPRASPSPRPDREPHPASRLEEEWKALHQTALVALETSVAPHPLHHPHHHHHPHLPSSSSPSALRGAGLAVPSSATRSPSPQFAPPRLTDKPPAPAHQEEPSKKTSDLSEMSDAVRKVPVRIVHAETSLERRGRQYLLNSGALGGPRPTPPQSTLPSQEQVCSPFSAYLRREEEAHRHASAPQLGPGVTVALAGAAQDGQAARAGVGAASGNRSDEDVKREELARDIMGKDKSLADILDQSRMRTTMDLMGGIFPQGEQVLEGAQQRRRVAPRQTSPRTSDERRVEDDLAMAVSVVSSSSYYSTSAPKAELLIKMKDMQEMMEEQDSEDELDYDLSSKKQELISSLSRKLQVLHEARESLQEDVQDNNALGEEVEATVQAVCKPNELDKFRMFIGDLDKVVSLLLSLSGRLARVENALNNLEEGASPEEKHALTEKRRLLIRQHEDAKELKENLDRRERLVYDILASYLSAERLADYEHFVKMKSALIIEQRKLEDKIKLGEEQLKCLKDSLPLEQRLML